jgi:hypothetical protein
MQTQAHLYDYDVGKHCPVLAIDRKRTILVIQMFKISADRSKRKKKQRKLDTRPLTKDPKVVIGDKIRCAGMRVAPPYLVVSHV